MNKPFAPLSRQEIGIRALGLRRDPLASEVLALEPRMVFDGAGLAVATDAAKQAADATDASKTDASKTDASKADPGKTDAATSTADAAAELAKNLAAAVAPPAPALVPQEVVFIDSRVGDIDAFKQTAGSSRLVVVVESTEDGIAKISETLKGLHDVAAVHIIGHGQDGAFELGKDWIGVEAIRSHEVELHTWAASLAIGADILLYGCDVAKGAAGQELIATLASEAGADVAASADAVGKTEQNADWSLEKTTGTIEASVIAPEGYDYRMAASPDIVVSYFNDDQAPVLITGITPNIQKGAYSLAANWTNDLTPTFGGTGAVANATVSLYTLDSTGNAKLVGRSTATAAGAFTVTVGVGPGVSAGTVLSAGRVDFVIKQQAGADTESAGLGDSLFSMNVVTVAPPAFTVANTIVDSVNGVVTKNRTNEWLEIRLTDAQKAVLQGRPYAIGVARFASDGTLIRYSRSPYATLASNGTSVGVQPGAVCFYDPTKDKDPTSGMDLTETYYFYLVDAAGNLVDGNGTQSSSGAATTKSGLSVDVRFFNMAIPAINSILDDSDGPATAVDNPTVVNGKTVIPVINDLTPTFKGTDYRDGAFFTAKLYNSAGAGLLTLNNLLPSQSDPATGKYEINFDFSKIPNFKAGTYTLVLYQTKDSLSSDTGYQTQFTYDATTPVFRFADLMGSAQIQSLTDYSLVDAVTLVSDDASLKAPGTTLTASVEVTSYTLSGNSSSVVETLSGTKQYNYTITVGANGKWTFAMPSVALGNGLKSIKATVTDVQGQSFTLQPVKVFLTGASTPGGLGQSNLMAWYDPTLQNAVLTTNSALTSGSPVTAVLDLSGNGNNATQSAVGNQPTFYTDPVTGVSYIKFINALTGSGVVATATDYLTLPALLTPMSVVYAASPGTYQKTTLDQVGSSTALFNAVSDGSYSATYGFYVTGGGIPTGYGLAYLNPSYLVPTLETKTVDPQAVVNGAFSLSPPSVVRVNLNGSPYSVAATDKATSVIGVAALGGRFTGYMGLTVFYSRTLSTAELEVLANVQSQQFALALNTGVVDRYQVVSADAASSTAQQLKYGKEVGGILNTESGATLSSVSTASAGGLTITDSATASFLATNGNSIFFGNNGESAQFRKVVFQNTENPDITRFVRDWAVDVTGTAPAGGGAVNVSFDVALLAAQSGQNWNDVARTYTGRRGMSLAWRPTPTSGWQIIGSSDTDVLASGGKIEFKNVVVGEGGLRDGFLTLMDGPTIRGITNVDAGGAAISNPTTTFKVEMSEATTGLSTASFNLSAVAIAGSSISGARILSVKGDSGSLSTSAAETVSAYQGADGKYYVDVLVNVGRGSGTATLDYDFTKVTGVDTGDNAGNAMIKTTYSTASVRFNYAVATATVSSFTDDVGPITFTDGVNNDPRPTDDSKPTLVGVVASAGNGLGAATSVNVYVDGAITPVNVAVSGTSWTFTPSTALGSGQHSFVVRGVDAQGNESEPSSPFTFKIDVDAPNLTAMSTDKSLLKAGDTATVSFTFSELPVGLTNADFVVTGGGTLGALTRDTSNLSIFRYLATYQPPSATTSQIRIAYSATADGGFTDTAGNTGVNQAADLTFNVDTQAPTVATVALDASSKPVSGAYKQGETLLVKVSFSEAVKVSTTGGAPRIAVRIGSTTRYATYSQASGSDVTFSYTIAAGDTDVDGVSIPANALDSNGGAITDQAGNVAVLSHAAVADDLAYSVDTTAPTVTMATSDLLIGQSQTATITFTASEPISGLTKDDFTVVGGTLGELSLQAGSDRIYTATFTPASVGDATIKFKTGGAYQDLAGNAGAAATPTLTISVAANTFGVSTVALTGGIGNQGVYFNADDTIFATVTFNENVTVDTTGGSPWLKLNVGGVAGFATFVGATGKAVTFGYKVPSDVHDPNGVSILANGLLDNGATFKNARNDRASLTFAAVPDNPNYIVDNNPPAALAVIFDSATGAQNNTLNAGDTIKVKATFSEIVTVTNTPRIALNIGGTIKYATYVSGSGSADLIFAYVIESGLTDTNGIAIVANGLDLNGTGVIADVAGNTAGLLHSSVADNPSYLVDTTAPSVSAVAFDSAIGAQNDTLNAGDTIKVKVTFSENVTVTNTPRLALNIGGTTKYATYLSGSGGADLIFAYVIESGLTDTNGIAIAANALDLNGAGVIADAAGNPATLVHGPVADDGSYKVDTTKPAVPGLTLGAGVADGATAAEATAATGVVSVTAESASNVVVSFSHGANRVTKTVTGGGATPVPVVLTSADLGTLGDGVIQVSVVATDAAGNASDAATSSFTLNTGKPATPSLTLGVGVSDGATAAEATAATGVVSVKAESGSRVLVTFSNGGNTVSKTVNGAGAASVPVNLTSAEVATLGDGAINVTAVATDTAGNVSDAGTSSFTLDTSPPATPGLALGTGVSNGATAAEATAATGVVSVTAENGSRVVVTFSNGGNTVAKTVTGVGATSMPVTLTSADLATLGDGVIKVSAVATDAAGNASGAGTTAFTLDTSKPAAPSLTLGTGVPDGATAAEATAPSGVVTVTAENGSTVDVIFRNGAHTVTKTVPGAGTTPVAVTLTSADLTTLGDGAVSVSATATDAAGNVSDAGTSSFTLDTSPPATPGLALGTGVSDGATAAEATAATGVVSVTAENGSRVVVTFSKDGKTVAKTVTGEGATPVAVTLTSADLTTLGDGVIGVSAVATDAAGNVSDAGTTSFTLDTVRPATPILAPGAGVSNGATAAEATATTGVVTVMAENGSSVAVTFNHGGKTVTKTVTGVGATPVAVTLTSADLATLGDGEISVSAAATDAAGNASDAGTISFTLDTRKPATPSLTLGTGVADGATAAEATAATGAVTVAAEKGSSVAVTFANGGKSVSKTIIGAGSTPVAVTLTSADLATLGDGAIGVSAVATDAAGNASDAGTATFTLDTTPPMGALTGYADNAGNQQGTFGFDTPTNDRTPTINGTGETGASVELFRKVGANLISLGSTKIVGGVWSITPAADLAEGAHQLVARITDAVGNSSLTSESTVTIDLATQGTLDGYIDTTVSAATVVDFATPASALQLSYVGTAEKGATVELFVRDGATETRIGAATADAATGAWSLRPTTDLAENVYTIFARVTDKAGNTFDTKTETLTINLPRTTAALPVIVVTESTAVKATTQTGSAARIVSDPVQASFGSPIASIYDVKPVKSLVVTPDADVVPADATGSVPAGAGRSARMPLVEYTSYLRPSFIEIAVSVDYARTGFVAARSEAQQVDAVKVTPSSTYAPWVEDTQTGRVLVRRDGPDEVRFQIEITLQDGSIIRQDVRVDVRSGQFEVRSAEKGASVPQSLDQQLADVLWGDVYKLIELLEDAA